MANGHRWNMGVVSRRWVWLVDVGGIWVWLAGGGCESMGAASGHGCKEVYRFPHITYPYSSCICSFFSSIPTFFFFFLNVFRSCSSTFCNLCNNFFAQYKHTYGQLQASHGSHMKGCT